MAHESIQPADTSFYYEGDALHIPFEVYGPEGNNRLDITGSTVEFVMKETRTDSDADAALTKSSTNSGEAEITDGTNGQAMVYIDTGDTDGLLTDGSDRLEEKEFFWVFRVTDDQGNRVTTVEGDLVVNAS